MKGPPALLIKQAHSLEILEKTMSEGEYAL